MPLCDSSETYTRAVRPEPSPAVLRRTLAAGIFEVSRFSCMKFLGVSGVFDYAGPSRNSRYRPCPCCLPRITKTSASGIASFRSSIAHPTYSPVYASPCTSRYPTQNSGPSGSLLLTRKNFPFSASCRFIPAHCNGDFSPIAGPLPLNSGQIAFHANVLPDGRGTTD